VNKPEKHMDKIQPDLIILHMMMHMFLVIQDMDIIHKYQDKEVHMEVYILMQQVQVYTHMHQVQVYTHTQHQLHMLAI